MPKSRGDSDFDMKQGIWLLGKDGMLGRAVAQELRQYGVPVIATGHEHDVTDRDALLHFAEDLPPVDWVVNCSAYTAVDAAEDNQEVAYSVNRDGPENLALVANSIGAALIQVSTDYVFDGKKHHPYVEDDPVSPINVYGASKAAGEKAVLATCPRSLIMRTSWLYHTAGSNFALTMLRLFRERPLIRVVDDQWGGPTFAGDLAELIARLTVDSFDHYGIFHFANGGETSWYRFARAILEEARNAEVVLPHCEIIPVEAAEYTTKARRPSYTVLSTDKIVQATKRRIRTWNEALKDFIQGVAAQR